MSGGAPRSHSISPAAVPPGAATAPNPWPWPAKPGLSDATAGVGGPRAAHHRSPGPPPSPATRPPRGPSPLSTHSHLPLPCAVCPPPTDPVLPAPYPSAPDRPAPRTSPYLPISLSVGLQAAWRCTPMPASPPQPCSAQPCPRASHLPAPSPPLYRVLTWLPAAHFPSPPFFLTCSASQLARPHLPPPLPGFVKVGGGFLLPLPHIFTASMCSCYFEQNSPSPWAAKLPVLILNLTRPQMDSRIFGGFQGLFEPQLYLSGEIEV